MFALKKKMGSLGFSEEIWVAVGLFVLAFFVRVIFLGKAELWCDEIIYINRSSPPFTPWSLFADRLENFSKLSYMPLPGMIHNACIWVFSPLFEDIKHAAFFHRMPAVVFGALSVSMVYKLGSLLSSRRVALASALMLCFFFFPFFYSRDARFYSSLLFFTTWSGYLYLKTISSNRIGKGSIVLLYIVLVCTALSMLNGIIFVGSIFGTTSILLVLGKLSGNRYLSDRQKVLTATAIVSFLALLTISPFLYKYISGLSDGTVGQVGSAQVMNLLPHLRDWVGKSMMGANPAMFALSVVLLGIGIIGCFRKTDDRPLVCSSLFIITLTVTVLWIGVFRNKYYFARIFYLVTAIMYFHVAHGLEFIAELLAQRFGGGKKWMGAVFPTAIVALIGIHFLGYVVPSYGLDTKHKMAYGKIANWVNSSLPSGTPCLIDEFHEQRFLPNFFSVSGHPVLSAPKVTYPGGGRLLHGPPLARLVEQFPELCWIESWGSHRPADPRAEQVYGLFQQKHVIPNSDLQEITTRGIMPQNNERAGNIGYYGIRVWYNSPADIEAKFRNDGKAMLPSYPGWSVAPVFRQPNGEVVYARVANGHTGRIELRNIGDRSIVGDVIIRGAISTPENKVNMILSIYGEKSQSTSVKPGTFWTVAVSE